MVIIWWFGSSAYHLISLLDLTKASLNMHTQCQATFYWYSTATYIYELANNSYMYQCQRFFSLLLLCIISEPCQHMSLAELCITFHIRDGVWSLMQSSFYFYSIHLCSWNLMFHAMIPIVIFWNVVEGLLETRSSKINGMRVCI